MLDRPSRAPHALRVLTAAALLWSAAPRALRAQVAAVDAPGVRLRTAPSTRSAPARTLRHNEALTVLGPDSLRRGFYHVRTARGDEGWVAGEYVRVTEPRSAAEPLLAAPSPPPPRPATVLDANAPAAAVSAAWDKPPIKHATFTFAGKKCGFFGSGGGDMDRSTNERKNRADEPTAYHAVQFDAVADPARLPWPGAAPTNRDDWTDEQLAAIAPLEGAPISVTGYIRKIKPQKKSSGKGESTNCGMIVEAGTDWHVPLVGHFDDPESASLVVETTPRFKRKHGAHWLRAALSGYENPHDPGDSVRVSGFLMLDPHHVDHLGKYRQTLWEIHPVTRIEVFRAGGWVDLDNLP